MWQIGFGDFPDGGATFANGDGDGDGFVDGNDFLIWQGNFGTTQTGTAATVPEPAAVVLMLATVVACIGARRQMTV